MPGSFFDSNVLLYIAYDAMIAAAALRTGCDRLWSEDMQHGMLLLDRLRIVNPFRND